MTVGIPKLEELRFDQNTREYGKLGLFFLFIKDRMDRGKEMRKQGEDPDFIDILLG